MPRILYRTDLDMAVTEDRALSADKQAQGHHLFYPGWSRGEVSFHCGQHPYNALEIRYETEMGLLIIVCPDCDAQVAWIAVKERPEG